MDERSILPIQARQRSVQRAVFRECTLSDLCQGWEYSEILSLRDEQHVQPPGAMWLQKVLFKVRHLGRNAAGGAFSFSLPAWQLVLLDLKFNGCSSVQPE